MDHTEELLRKQSSSNELLNKTSMSMKNINRILNDNARDGNIAEVRALLNIADINNNDGYNDTYYKDNYDYITKYGYNTGGPLWISATNGHTETVKLLLDAGANINTVDNCEKIRYNCYKHARNGCVCALIDAATNGHTSVVELLLKNGANIHARNNRALKNAILEKRAQVIKVLVENGANINDCDEEQPMPKSMQQNSCCIML